VYNREKDAQSATAQWFSGLLYSQPWFSDVVPDVCRVLLVRCLTRAKELMIYAYAALVPTIGSIRTPRRHQQRNLIHLSLHQHATVPALLTRQMPSSRCRRQASSPRRHLRSPRPARERQKSVHCPELHRSRRSYSHRSARSRCLPSARPRCPPPQRDRRPYNLCQRHR